MDASASQTVVPGHIPWSGKVAAKGAWQKGDWWVVAAAWSQPNSNNKKYAAVVDKDELNKGSVQLGQEGSAPQKGEGGQRRS